MAERQARQIAQEEAKKLKKQKIQKTKLQIFLDSRKDKRTLKKHKSIKIQKRT